ncbi:MAG: 2-dehydro-3-deoxygalactonokinase, partial [Boseongicola sp.]
WGTSNLRAWAMHDDRPIAAASTDDGMGSLDKSEFEPVLSAAIGPWLAADHTPIIACGMLGSLQGWVEAPYANAPTKPLSNELVRAESYDTRYTVHVIPGIKQLDPPDVMRGEETQIAGFLKTEPNFDGVICLPGTHTKWAQISAGEVVSFRTFLTGELFDLLSKKSVLRHSVGGNWDASAFDEAITDTMARPEALAASLFRLRADDLLNGTSPDKTRSRLSGLLIGAEFAAARPYWLGQRIALIGSEKLAEHYAKALGKLEVETETVDATSATLAGLGVARQLVKESYP